MSDSPESSSSPFAAFSSASGFDMMEKMWRMIQVPGLSGTPSPSSMMSDMMAPMTNIDELDKRITDMRAVEQWLKLNLNMLQSAIQALEVQRATLATLKAFGAFAQSSMEQAAANSPEMPKAAAKSGADTTPGATDASSAADPLATMDPTPWWNLLQAQFNQIAGLAMAAQPPSGPVSASASKTSAKTTSKTTTSAAGKTATASPQSAGVKAAAAAKTAAKPVRKSTRPKTEVPPGKA